ncbi:hypothetical protein EZV62_015641 [Acer yangbiense]|uniref:DUF1985 domain-containing protein n=1 Tax=Acer yangbiense TaxID=1000413 RepID=A0A5C7HND0_9ROSI|nr:hypothetical protein EZV62_015641 [Acer yangbiense]
MWFAVGGKTLRFSIQEFCFITGLECGPKPSVLSKEKRDSSGSFRSSMLNGEVKLALLHFLETVLFGMDQKVHIGAHHVELLEDLETFNKYPWGRKCYETTLNSLQRDLRRMSHEYHTTSREIVLGKKRKRQANKEKECIRQYLLHGFPYAFQIWACEAIPVVGVAIAVKFGSLLPRIVNWITPGTPDATYVMKLLDRKYVSLKNSNHWILAEVDFIARKIIMYDSEKNFIGSRKKFIKFMEPLSTLFPLLLHAIDFFSKRPEIHHREDMTPRLVKRCENVLQQEKSDCRVFVIKFLEHLIHGESIDTVQAEKVKYFRQQLCLNLWRSRKAI